METTEAEHFSTVLYLKAPGVHFKKYNKQQIIGLDEKKNFWMKFLKKGVLLVSAVRRGAQQTDPIPIIFQKVVQPA